MPATVTPVITTIIPDTGASIADGITNSTVLTIGGSAAANASVTLQDQFGQIGVATANGSGGWSVGVTLGEGQYVLAAVATDTGGTSASTDFALNIDTTPPATPSLAIVDQNGHAVSGASTVAASSLTFSGTTDPLIFVTVMDGSSSIGGVFADRDGAWSLTVSHPSDGTHNFTAQASDLAGNVSGNVTSTVTIDTTAPAAPSIATIAPDTGALTTDHLTKAAVLSIAGAAEANATITVSDGATVLGSTASDGSGAWSFTTVALAEGAHSFTASATDGAGNTGIASAAVAVTVDLTAPGVPTIASIGPDTGRSASDGLTSATHLTVTGTAEANATVTVLDGSATVGSAVATSGGAWSLTADFAAGSHSLSAVTTDLAGNGGEASAPLAITVDTIAPAAPSLDVTDQLGHAVSGGATVAASALTLSGSTEASDAVTLTDGATTLGTVTADGSGAWSFSVNTPVEGAHSFAASATDLAGNIGSAASLTITVDTTAPAAPILTGVTPDSGRSTSDMLTDTSHVTLTGSAEANATVTVLDGTATLGSAIAGSGGAWSLTADLTEGGHTVSASATDSAGNRSAASASETITIDTTAPAAPSLAAADQLGHAVSGGATVSASALTLSGSTEASDAVTITDGATVLGIVTANGSGAWSFGVSTPSEGTHSFAATASDLAGNVGSAASLTVTIDTTAPAVPTIAGFTPDTGRSSSDRLTDATHLTVTGTAEANTTVTLSDGATTLGSAVATGGNWSVTTDLAAGSHTVTAVAADGAGNGSAASASLAITVDTSAPTAPSLAATDQLGHAVGGGATVSASALTLSGSTEASDAVTITDGATTLGTVTADGSGAWSFGVSTPSDGAHSFAASATDLAGNIGAAASLTVTVDTVAPAAPSLAATDDHGAPVTEGSTVAATALTLSGSAEAGASITVEDGSSTIGSVVATGGGAWSLAVSNASAVTHHYVALATDSAGNVGAASTVLDVTIDRSTPTAPVIAGITPDTGSSASDFITSAGSLTLTGSADGNATIGVSDGAVLLGTATADGAGAWSLAASLAAGSHGLSAVATNLAGTSGPSSVTTTVTIDVSAPAAPSVTGITPDTGASSSDHLTDTTSLAIVGTAEADAIVAVTDGATALGTATANGAGAWSLATSLAEGSHSITAIATDLAGNIGGSSGALAVTVDTTAPAAPSLGAADAMGDTIAAGAMLSAGSVTLSGSAEAGARVAIEDGSTVLGTVTTDGSGGWSFDANLGGGSHSLIAVATDQAGNLSPASSSFALTVEVSGGGSGGGDGGGGGGGGEPPPPPPTGGDGRIIGHVGPNGTLPDGFDLGANMQLDLTGIDGPVVIDNLSGNDVITLGSGTVSLTASSGSDQIIIPADAGGTHSFIGFAGNHTVSAASGTNTLLGGLGDNHFDISGGVNLLGVVTGNNAMNLSGGSNALFAGAGSDTIATSGSSQNIIVGGAGHMVVNANGAQDFIFTGSGAASIQLGSGAESILAGAGTATITGGTGPLLMSIGGGSQTLDLTAGSDTIFGGGGSATISVAGGAHLMSLLGTDASLDLAGGTDTVFGGSGNLAVTVGGGTGMLALAANSGDVTITNFDPAHLILFVPHSIDGGSFASAGQLPVTHDAAGDVVLQIGTGATAHHITLVGVTQFDASSVVMF